MISEELSYNVTEEFDLLELLKQTALFLWKDWPKDMEFSSIREDGLGFVIHGTCPHCSPTQAAFQTVTQPFSVKVKDVQYLVAVARCIACREFILAAIKYDQRIYGGPNEWNYALHYPVAKPTDKVPDEVPEQIRNDFSEALRCQWVKAYNATAEMCRRTVESSCINLGAPYSKVLQEMIDWLHVKGTITEALKNVAHQVRLGGDRAAHPQKTPKLHQNTNR